MNTVDVFALLFLISITGVVWSMVRSCVWAYRYHERTHGIDLAYKNKQFWNITGIVWAAAAFLFNAAYELAKLGAK